MTELFHGRKMEARRDREEDESDPGGDPEETEISGASKLGAGEFILVDVDKEWVFSEEAVHVKIPEFLLLRQEAQRQGPAYLREGLSVCL